MYAISRAIIHTYLASYSLSLSLSINRADGIFTHGRSLTYARKPPLDITNCNITILTNARKPPLVVTNSITRILTNARKPLLLAPDGPAADDCLRGHDPLVEDEQRARLLHDLRRELAGGRHDEDADTGARAPVRRLR